MAAPKSHVPLTSSLSSIRRLFVPTCTITASSFPSFFSISCLPNSVRTSTLLLQILLSMPTRESSTNGTLSFFWLANAFACDPFSVLLLTLPIFSALLYLDPSCSCCTLPPFVLHPTSDCWFLPKLWDQVQVLHSLWDFCLHLLSIFLSCPLVPPSSTLIHTFCTWRMSHLWTRLWYGTCHS